MFVASWLSFQCTSLSALPTTWATHTTCSLTLLHSSRFCSKSWTSVAPPPCKAAQRHSPSHNHARFSPTRYSINNLGDPFVESNYGVHSRTFEVDVLNFFADLWRIPRDEYVSLSLCLLLAVPVLTHSALSAFLTLTCAVPLLHQVLGLHDHVWH